MLKEVHRGGKKMQSREVNNLLRCATVEQSGAKSDPRGLDGPALIPHQLTQSEQQLAIAGHGGPSRLRRLARYCSQNNLLALRRCSSTVASCRWRYEAIIVRR